jgi:hypothetical protein
MNVGLTLGLPTIGLAYSTAGASLAFDRSAAGLIALGVFLVTAAVAANTIRRPYPLVVTRRIPENLGRPVTPQSSVVDVSRPPSPPWSWRSLVLAPLELLAVAWSVPVVILLIAAPIALVVAALLWLGRLMVRL